MRDICFMRYQKLARVDDAAISDRGPGHVLITGTGFTFAVEVLINGYYSKFEVLSDTEIEARIPANVEGQEAVETVDVYVDSAEFDAEDMEFFITQDTRSGLALLCQQFVKLLLTTPGTDLFDVAAGGGLVKAVQSTSLDDAASLAGAVTTSISRTVKQIMAVQASQVLVDEEALVSAKALRVTPVLGTLTVEIELVIVSRGGAARVNFATGGAA